jgi:hypothetical protein
VQHTGHEFIASCVPEFLRVKNAGGHILKHATIEFMRLALFAMRVLEVMFFAGLVGSAVVVLISFYEDGKELFGKD